MPFSVLTEALKAHEESEVNKLRTLWEVNRMGWFFYINTKLKKGKQIKDPKKLIKFEWEEVDVEKQDHKQNIELAKKRFLERKEKQKNAQKS